MDRVEILYENAKLDWLLKNNQEYRSLLSGGSMNDNIYVYEPFYVHTEDIKKNDTFVDEYADHIIDCRRKMFSANGVFCKKDEINLSFPMSQYMPTVPYAYLTMEYIDKSTYMNPNVILYNSPNDCSINSILNKNGELRYAFGYVDGIFSYEEPIYSGCLKTFKNFPSLAYKLIIKNVSGVIDMSNVPNISIFISATFDSCDFSNTTLYLPEMGYNTELKFCNCVLREEQIKQIRLECRLNHIKFINDNNEIIPERKDI